MPSSQHPSVRHLAIQELTNIQIEMDQTQRSKDTIETRLKEVTVMHLPFSVRFFHVYSSAEQNTNY